MKYYIYSRTLLQAQEFASEHRWSANEWGLLVLDIDEPYARIVGHYDEEVGFMPLSFPGREAA